MSEPSGVTVSPEPSPAELAAILAAYEALWPKFEVAAEAPPAPGRWRFSGRRWSDTAPSWGGWR